MNRYPLWKYITIALTLVLGIIYSLPNLFGEMPAVQISSAQTGAKVDENLMQRIEAALQTHQLHANQLTLDVGGKNPSVRVRLSDTDTQLRVKDLLQNTLNPNAEDPAYIVALNLLPASPQWLTDLHALPMYLGLDLRGGVYFLLKVDMAGAINKKLDTVSADIRNLLRDKNINHAEIARQPDQTIKINFANSQDAQQAQYALTDKLGEELQYTQAPPTNGQISIIGTLTEQARRTIKNNGLQQNIVTLHNRVNELGVAEPLIQQEGEDRIAVQLPGVQDTAKAKELIGRTATLEARLADADAPRPQPGMATPPGDELFTKSRVGPIFLKRQVIFTGDRIMNASAGFNDQQQPSVNIRLDAAGGRAMQETSRENIGKPMAIILFEKGKGEVITAPAIRSELNDSFQISPIESPEAANDLALLLRAGSLAAPMEIIEEHTIGPSLGADNIKKGFNSVHYGFIAIALFMMAYYLFFGIISTLALSINLVFLIAILSILQATLTLPGIAAIAFTLGMAIDSNVLINERIREELREGASPQTAISSGFDHAWATILDSNVTTLIAGLALLAFGSGPIRGFAIVHCIGILTSMFSSVFFARGLVNLWYGNRRKLKSLSIGQVWRPNSDKQ